MWMLGRSRRVCARACLHPKRPCRSPHRPTLLEARGFSPDGYSNVGSESGISRSIKAVVVRLCASYALARTHELDEDYQESMYRANVLAPSRKRSKKSNHPENAENDSFVYQKHASVPRYSMGLKLTTRDPENFGFADSQGCRWHGRFVARIL
jgi:hypothetical protein